MAKKEKSTPKHDSERETRVLLEKIGSDVKAVAEQHGSIMRKLEEHDEQFGKIGQKLEEHDDQFEKIGQKLEEHDAQFEKIGQKLEEHDAQFGKIGQKLEEHDGKLGKLDRIESELNSVGMAVTENGRTIKRVENKLDTKITDHEQRLQKLEAVK